jgi:hypothetical protein
VSLDASSGLVQWVDPLVQAEHSPALDGNGTLYLTLSSFDVAAVDAGGDLLWSTSASGWTPCLGPNGEWDM